jgi:hypothetical protein
MLYFMMNQVLTLFVCALFFVCIKIFSKQFLVFLTTDGHILYGAVDVKHWLSGSGLGTWFGVLYGTCIVFIFIVSLAGPIDRAMFYFKFSSVFFSIATLGTIVGIAFLNLNAGANP